MPAHLVSIKFKNYKTFRDYTVLLSGFNVLVGPNNAGKSTVIGALRILGEGLRRAHARKAEYLDSIVYRGYGYRLDLRDLPISTENIFTDYDDAEPATIDFSISPGGVMRLIFPESDACIFVVDTTGRIPQTPSEFKKHFDFSLSFVPVLGPVEHDEQLFQEDAARRALQTHRASRNFRNIWYHYPEKFSEFAALIQQTWPDTTIKKPELTHGEGVARLHMFYEEKRFSREMFWSGFGFQAWCQMLTFITKASEGSFLVIDEPDVYLHSDIQRQLIQFLRDRQGDSLIATHSTEMLSEAESGEIIVIDRKVKRSRKIARPLDLAGVFTALGSVLNPMLTQLSKTRRVLFVEGGDFGVLGAFARKLGKNSLANQSAFAVVPAYGFNPARVRDFSEGIEKSLGFEVQRAVIFDRDYRIPSEVEKIKSGISGFCSLCHIHDRKEIENYLLVPSAISRCIQARLKDREKRGSASKQFSDDVKSLLENITEELKPDIFGHFSSRVIDQFREENKAQDASTLHSRAHALFEEQWKDFDRRLAMVPGKKVLAKLNEFIQKKYSVALSPKAIVSAMYVEEIPRDIAGLMSALENFCRRPV
ncbi:ATP-binding protein [uncultured Xanthomonas sp.]|uniref:ATP-dependent nuclease n=1 Tax=uncultured Xanthomonas sp. TaxID=152831 RepID=UPI0025E86489|nr:ATP-binding protein [uncultured Xanthomonas sp.]